MHVLDLIVAKYRAWNKRTTLILNSMDSSGIPRLTTLWVTPHETKYRTSNYKYGGPPGKELPITSQHISIQTPM